MTHFYPIPSVRLIVLDNRGRLLALRRAAGTYLGGSWTLPGGKIDYGQSPEDAARRELAEETGLEAENLKFLFWQDSPPLQPGTIHAINFYYQCEAKGEIQISAKESEDFAWLDPDDPRCDQLAFRGAQAVARWREQNEQL